MIFKRYGTSLHSVEMNFDSKALNEIGFRRDRVESIPADAWETEWEKVEEHAFEATAEGPVQDEAEQATLDEMREGITALLGGLPEGDVLYVESEQGADYPKTRHTTKGVIVDGENKLVFYARIEPALRIGHYRRR